MYSLIALTSSSVCYIAMQVCYKYWA